MILLQTWKTKSDTLKVKLNKIVSKLNSLYKKEEKLVSMNLDGKISDSVYEDKFNQIQIEKEKLLEEKVNLEVTLKSEVDIKSRLENFKEILTSQKTLTEFDKAIFESIVEKIIVGGINSDGEIDPAMLTIIFKTGDSSTKDAKSYKSKRKNAKIENDKLCFNAVTDDEKKCTNKENSACRVCKFVSEMWIIVQNSDGLEMYKLELYQNPSYKDLVAFGSLKEGKEFVSKITGYILENENDFVQGNKVEITNI